MRNDYTDYIQHGLFSRKHKYVAKVKYGPGATAARYFYNNDDYQAYLKNRTVSGPTAPLSVKGKHSLNQVRLRAKNVGSTLSKNAADLGKKAKHAMDDVKFNLHTAAFDTSAGAKKAFKKASSSLKNSKAALTAKYNMSVLSDKVKKNVSETFGHGEKNNKMSKIEKAAMRAKIVTGKWKTAAAPHAKKAWREAGYAYRDVEKKLNKAANNAKENYKYYIEPAIKSKASAAYNKAENAVKSEVAVSQKELKRARKRIGHYVADTMSAKLNAAGGNNEEFKRAMAAEYRKKMKQIDASTVMPEEKLLWKAQLAKSAKQNGFAKYLLSSK